MNQTKKKIVWAINPYEPSAPMDQRTETFFKSLSQYISYEIQPVYVMTSGFAQMRSYIKDINYEDLIYKTKSDCEKYLAQFSSLSVNVPHIIENKLALRSSEARSFEQYLDKAKPDFVCIASHGKKSPADYLLGSFAEAYLTRAKYVTFVVGPNFNEAKDLSKAFVPVEVNEDDDEFLSEFLASSGLGFIRESILFHKMSLADYQETIWAPAFHQFDDKKRQSVEEQAKQSVVEFLTPFQKRQSFMKININIYEEHGIISDIVVDEANKSSCGLIVMKSNCGPMQSVLLGSITKEIINKAKQPVVVYPNFFEF